VVWWLLLGSINAEWTVCVVIELIEMLYRCDVLAELSLDNVNVLVNKTKHPLEFILTCPNNITTYLLQYYVI